MDEDAVRLGLALYRRSVQSGFDFYRIYDLLFDDETRPTSLYSRLSGKETSFWSLQTEAARILDGAGIASVQRKRISGTVADDYSIKLTAFGRTIYSLASLQADSHLDEIEGLTIEDIDGVLKSDLLSQELGNELRGIDAEIAKLDLSNFQYSTVTSYVNILVAICEMPQGDSKLFWIVLERLSHFAGVASLIVALIALRLVK
ncbi:MAG: hypothetical protein ACR2O7_11675 [Parasphingorhabdus sp.]